MAANSFGQLFRILTWGESHGPAVGCVVDGCPAGLKLTQEEIQAELSLRAPGLHPHTSKRREEDIPEILSGVFEGKTTGAPISILIRNVDVDSSKYEPIKHLLRPGHANYTYEQKYGLFDYRGGGRASARETAPRVAAGAIAKKLISHAGIQVKATLLEPNAEAIEEAMAEGDSLGGLIEFVVAPMIVGLGDPMYEKLEANLAKALLTIPGCKGFEMGSGFASVKMRGSLHNDPFTMVEGKIGTTKNDAGGILGGISNGMPLVGRVAFKPASSIRIAQKTVTETGQPATLTIPEGSRHDPCIAIRAVAVVEAMVALVLADSYLMQRAARL